MHAFDACLLRKGHYSLVQLGETNVKTISLPTSKYGYHYP